MRLLLILIAGGAYLKLGLIELVETVAGKNTGLTLDTGASITIGSVVLGVSGGGHWWQRRRIRALEEQLRQTGGRPPGNRPPRR